MPYIEPCRKPELKTCVMSCDKPLHKKLDRYEMTKTCFNKHQFCAIIGLAGSGKSSLIYSMFQSKRVFAKTYTRIFYFCPASSMDSMADNIFLDNLPEEQIYNELDTESLEEVIHMCKTAHKSEKIAIIIDDFASKLRDKGVKRLIKDIVQNRRHLHASLFILSQTWFSLEPEIRRQISNLIIFKVSKDTMKTIFNEVVEQHEDKAEDIVKLVYDEPHQYLVLNVASGKMFKGFDRICFEDPE